MRDRSDEDVRYGCDLQPVDLVLFDWVLSPHYLLLPQGSVGGLQVLPLAGLLLGFAHLVSCR